MKLYAFMSRSYGMDSHFVVAESLEAAWAAVLASGECDATDPAWFDLQVLEPGQPISHAHA